MFYYNLNLINKYKIIQSLAAVTRERRDENLRNGQSRNTSVPRMNEEYVTQVSEEIEGRVTKKLSQRYSSTESRILDALYRLDEFLVNQQIRTHSGTVAETFRNTNLDNQGTNDDDSQSDPHPEAGLFRSQTTQNSGPEFRPYMVLGATERHDMVTGVTEEVRNGIDVVTRVQKESLCSHDMVTGVTKEVRHGHDVVTGGQKRFVFVLTCGQEFKKKFVSISTWRQKLKKRFPSAGLELPQENKRRLAPQVSHNFAVRIPLRQLKQTRFCWPFNNWRQTVIKPSSTTISQESQNCLSPSRQQCPPWRGVREIWTVWRSIPNEFKNPQSAHRRRQNKLFPLSHAWWCAADVQKHQQPKPRESGTNSDCVP